MHSLGVPCLFKAPLEHSPGYVAISVMIENLYGTPDGAQVICFAAAINIRLLRSPKTPPARYTGISSHNSQHRMEENLARTGFQHANPILSVADMAASVNYYVNALGFINADWGN